MSLSRRGFLQGVLGLVAGLVGSRVIGSPPPVIAAPCLPASNGLETPETVASVSNAPITVADLRRIKTLLQKNVDAQGTYVARRFLPYDPT